MKKFIIALVASLLLCSCAVSTYGWYEYSNIAVYNEQGEIVQEYRGVTLESIQESEGVTIVTFRDGGTLHRVSGSIITVEQIGSHRPSSYVYYETYPLYYPYPSYYPYYNRRPAPPRPAPAPRPAPQHQPRPRRR